MFGANSSLPTKPAPVMDLSKIDFGALAAKFKESKHKNTDLEVLKATIRAMLERLISLNKTRADFAEKFEELIESYNNGSRNIEELFEELVRLSRSLSGEQPRHVRENMSEEELVIFDILTRPAPELSPRQARRSQKGFPRIVEQAQTSVGAELAAKVHRSVSDQARHRRRARHALRTEVLGTVRAHF
jgi:type I restriction enzyme R subunit